MEQIVYMSVDELIPYERNPRKNEQAVEAVANSIREFGFKVPIVVDKDFVVVSGHTRLKASKRLGMERVPVIVASELNDEQIRAFRLADNKVGELAEWDTDMLIAELDGLNMTQFGFDDMMELMDGDVDADVGAVEPKSVELDDKDVLIIEASNEAELERLFMELSERGFVCRISVL